VHASIGRAAPRAAFHGWVEITLNGARRRVSGTDLCTRGIGLRVPAEPPPPAAPLLTEFALPGIGLPLALRGVVAWCDPAHDRCGVRFLDVDPGLEELIASYVAGRL
jgi:hypothetical protein